MRSDGHPIQSHHQSLLVNIGTGITCFLGTKAFSVHGTACKYQNFSENSPIEFHISLSMELSARSLRVYIIKFLCRVRSYSVFRVSQTLSILKLYNLTGKPMKERWVSRQVLPVHGETNIKRSYPPIPIQYSLRLNQKVSNSPNHGSLSTSLCAPAQQTTNTSTATISKDSTIS